MFGHDHGQPFLGREFSSEPDYSDDVAREIDGEIRRIVEEAHQLARRILDQHREQLANTSEILLRRETIEREEFIQLLDGKPEEEVFGPDEPVVPQPAPPGPEAPQRRPEREAPRPLPRPGLAGGTAEMRSDDEPRQARRELPRIDSISVTCAVRTRRVSGGRWWIRPPASRGGAQGDGLGVGTAP